MKLSLTHLATYLDKQPGTDEMLAAIERCGIELEGVQTIEPLNTKIVVGLTKKVVQHPNADKLRLVLVDTGGELLHIVCGAPNVAEDMKVAVATVGAILPDGMEIREAKLRGELSQGMLCSEAELGWSDDHAGIVELPIDYQVGKSLCDIVENETIVHIKSAANRPDLQSYEGVAREIAAQLECKLILPQAKFDALVNPKLIKKSDKKAQAFAVAHLDVRHITQAPAEVGRVLRAAGIREINPIVDVTNYVSLTVGQPTHAFDAGKVSLPLHIRLASKGESVKTLNGKTNLLAPEDLVVADKNGPIDIAGVMGGLDTEVTDFTQEIILVASTLDAMLVRKSAQRHGIRTDASARYERGLPVELADRGRAIVIELLIGMGAKVISAARQGEIESPEVVVQVKPQRITTLLGIEVAPKDIIKHLHRLGFEVSGTANLKVCVPWWRPDVSNFADIAEEVIKLVGLDALPATIPAWSPHNIAFDSHRAQTDKLREILRSSGLFEVVTYSFISEQDIEKFGLKPADHLKLKNPLSIEQAYMRSTLLPSLVRVLENNQRYSKTFGVSEISNVFEPNGKKGDLPKETKKVAVAVMGDYYEAKRSLDLIDRELRLGLVYRPSKRAAYYPGRQADILLNGVSIGSIGELHPRLLSGLKGQKTVSYTEFNLEPVITAANEHIFEQISKYPSSSRDIAVVIDRNILWQEVVTVISENHPDAKVGFQSRYEGKELPDGKISLAFRATFVAMDRTLTDQEVEAHTSQIIKTLEHKFGATLRA